MQNSTGTLSLIGEAATIGFGRILAGCLRAGDIILLDGVVGAGKTTLARSVIRALTRDDQDVPSPTFTLVQTYSARNGCDLLHYDLYRLEAPEELQELAWDDVGGHGTITLIEWPNRIGHMPSGNVLHLQIDTGENNDERQLELHGHGDWGNRIGDLMRQVSA